MIIPGHSEGRSSGNLRTKRRGYRFFFFMFIFLVFINAFFVAL